MTDLIGQIGSGKNTRSGIIDIAIMQSLFEGEEKTVKSFVAEYGMVIVDLHIYFPVQGTTRNIFYKSH